MVAIKLPDGSILEMESGVNGFDIANKISPNLAKAALAINVNGTLQDLSTPITTDATVTIITGKDKEGLHILRHTCSHVMAQAVKELWPDVQVTIGPAIENGFYYLSPTNEWQAQAESIPAPGIKQYAMPSPMELQASMDIIKRGLVQNAE